MDFVYENQTALRIKLDTEADLTDATELEIRYMKPDGSEGSWTAQVLNSSSWIYYDIGPNDHLTPTGNWKRWSYVKFSDGREVEGDPVDFIVKKPGT
jgi:hypothetical protein